VEEKVEEKVELRVDHTRRGRLQLVFEDLLQVCCSEEKRMQKGKSQEGAERERMER
jgi:hypothetical protein